MSKTIPTNTDDTIDSRDVIARIEELEGDLRESHEEECGDEASSEFEAWLLNQSEDYNSEFGHEAAELVVLRELEKEAEGYASDWRHGVQLVADSYFERYARQFAEDVGAIPSDAAWPSTCIDWEKAAEELKQGYTAVEFGGETYWIR